MNNINNTSRIIVPIMTHRSNGSDVIRGSKCYEERCKTQEELALEKSLEKRRPVSSLLNQRIALSKKLHDRKDDRKDIKKDADLERVDLSKKDGKFFIPLGLSRPEILKEKWNAFNAWKKEALS